MRERLKILMVSLDFPPTVGGIAAHVYELSMALVRAGHDVVVLSKVLPQGKELDENINGVHVCRREIGFFGFLYGYFINKNIQKLSEEYQFDVVHVHGIRPLEFLNIDIPLVFTNHTSGFLKRIKKGKWHTAKLEKLFKKVAIFLAPSEELLNVPFKIRAIKKYIPNGVDFAKFSQARNRRADLRNKIGFTDEDVVAILTRRLVWKNGVNYLAEATKYIKNKRLKLLIIGDGEERQEIERKLRKNFKDRFVFLGSMTHEDIIDYYSASDFSILPSLMEATSISGLEAMASGLPIVGTKVGGIPDLVRDGKNGFLCKPANPEDMANKIDRLLEVDYIKMGEVSQQLVLDNYDWSNIARETLLAYYKVLQK